jgi:MFS family permease
MIRNETNNTKSNEENFINDNTSPSGKDNQNLLHLESEVSDQNIDLSVDKEGETKLAYDDPNNFPEGGFRAWMVVGAASTIMAMSFGMCNSFGIYQSYYEEKYYKTPSNVLGIIGALQAALTYFIALPSTILMIYLGPQLVVAFGGLLSCLAFMFLSISNATWQIFIIQGLMFGMGSGFMYIHSTGITIQYFNKRKALAVGIITAGSSLAGVYWPIGIRNMIEKIGFPWANRVIGFLYIPLTIFSALFIKPRYKPKPRQPNENLFRINFSVLKDWKFQLINVAWFSFMLSLFPGLFYIDLFCIRLGVSESLQLYSVAIINACALVFRVLPGLLADKFGRINILLPSLLLSGIFPLALWLPAHGTTMTALFIVFWASATGVPVAVFPALIGQLFQHTEHIYSYLTFFYLVGGLSSLLGPIIGGSFIPPGKADTIKGFDKLAIFCGVLCLASFIIMIVVRHIYTKSLITII